MPLTLRDTDTPEQITRHGYHNCTDECRDLTCICQCHHGSQLHVFIRAIVAAPADEALRLAFADYLEERGEYYACLRVRETARIRPEDYNGCSKNGWVWLWKPSLLTNQVHAPQWLLNTLGGVGVGLAGKCFHTNHPMEDGMRAIIEAILKGGPEWRPSSSGGESGSTGAGAPRGASAP